MTDDSNGWITFKCLEVTQPIGTFYIGVLESADLARLSYSDVRRIAGERREVETYLGIERPLSPKRIDEIKEYVRTLDASFPSSIIIAVDSADTRYDPQKGLLSLRDGEDIAKILDGQHRIAGVEGYDDTFELIVSVFVDMDIENQAMLFATINLEQTKVNKSLAYDLYEYTKARSPQKTAHNIVRLLHTKEGSPFQGKIKILGIAGEPEETLSQATFVDALLPLLSLDPVQDRDRLKRGKRLPKATTSEEKEQRRVFVNMFRDRRDADIARVLWNYFGAVEDRWTQHWREPIKGNILNRTTGFGALMQFLPYAYLRFAEPGDIPTRKQFKQLFDRVKLEGADFHPDEFSPGTAGQTKLRNRLLSHTRLTE